MGLDNETQWAKLIRIYSEFNDYIRSEFKKEVIN